MLNLIDRRTKRRIARKIRRNAHIIEAVVKVVAVMDLVLVGVIIGQHLH